MAFQHVVIGFRWERGQYAIAFTRTISPPRLADLELLDVEISKGYSDKMSVFGREKLEKIIGDDDRVALSELKQTADFFLLHRVEL